MVILCVPPTFAIPAFVVVAWAREVSSFNRRKASVFVQAVVWWSVSSMDVVGDDLANEMTKSNNLTSWPCPSFWDGVNKDNSGAAHKIASGMTPNCRDGDPYAQCTVNKDRCEVKKDAKCE